MPVESAAIAAIQRRSWAASADPISTAMLAAIDLQEMTTAWHSAITKPGEARRRVLVAVTGGNVVAVATTLPSEDPDTDPATSGEIEEFLVDPAAQRQGHGSRLVNACVDTLRADGFSRAQHWQRADDDIRRAFFVSSGWGPDGAFREIGSDDEQLRVKQVRLHTAI